MHKNLFLVRQLPLPVPAMQKFQGNQVLPGPAKYTELAQVSVSFQVFIYSYIYIYSIYVFREYTYKYFRKKLYIYMIYMIERTGAA